MREIPRVNERRAGDAAAGLRGDDGDDCDDDDDDMDVEIANKANE